MATTYIARTDNSQGFVARSSDTMAYTHVLVTAEGEAYSWHTSYANAQGAQRRSQRTGSLTIKPVEKHDGTKATVTRRLATTAPKEATMASTTAPEPTTVSATINQLLPGQTFEFNGQRLRMVKVGAASFRAEGDQGTVATYKANTAKRRVQLVGAPTAALSGRALLDQLADQGAAVAPKAEPKPKATRAPKASNLPAQGTLVEDGAGSTYTVRWIHGHDVLAKRTSGDAAKWLVICEHGTQQYADSAAHGDKVAQQRATWCATCAK